VQSPAIVSVALTERFVASLSATQRPATASASMLERFVAATSATQTPATFAAAMREIFALSAAAAQSPHAIAAAMAERFVVVATCAQPGHTIVASVTNTDPVLSEFTIDVVATQAPATMAAVLETPAIEETPAEHGMGGGGGDASVWIAPLPRQPRYAVEVSAGQSPHTMRAQLEVVAVANVAARQAGHRLEASMDSLGIAEDEEHLMVYLLKRAA
jgi:hypothetical protein